MRPPRSAAAQRRLSVLVGLGAGSLGTFLFAVVTASPIAWLLFAVVSVALAGFVRALRVRAIARRQAYIDRLWAKDRYDDLGHARVMSLEEARHRAVQIADPVYVPQRRIS
jgi:hypothetical protein